MHKIRIAIVDDHDLFRNGLAELLRKQPSIQIVNLARDGNEFLQQLDQNLGVDVVLLDISMPNASGFDVLDKLRAAYSMIYSIIISMHDDGHYIAKCAKKGAYGYLLKNADEEDLLKAINEVSQGKKYFPPEITERMINTVMVKEETLKELSKKEHEILQLIADGLTTKEVAHQLFVSNRTVETHRANILKKLKVKNTAELIKKAGVMGLI